MRIDIPNDRDGEYGMPEVIRFRAGRYAFDQLGSVTLDFRRNSVQP